MDSINQARRCAMELLRDDLSEQRDELVQSGVAPHRVLALYPLEISSLHPTLNAYLDAGGCMHFSKDSARLDIATRDQRRFEALDLTQRAAAHRALGSLMENPEAKTLWKRAAFSPQTTYNRNGQAQGAWKGAQEVVDMYYPHLYTAIWYALNVVGEDQQEAAKLLLDLTAELLPDLKVA